VLPRYICSELNPVDEFSRLINCDACCLQQSVKRMLLHKVTLIICSSVTLDAFVCHQSRVVLAKLGVTSLRASGVGFRRTHTQLTARSRVAESALGSPPRYHWQVRRGAASWRVDRAPLDVADVVTEPVGPGLSSSRTSISNFLGRTPTSSARGPLSAPRSSSVLSRVSAWESALAIGAVTSAVVLQ
jgi:hypothetical protein